MLLIVSCHKIGKMTVGDIKKYIYENEKVEFVLEALGCDKIVYHPIQEYYSACQPDGDNPQGVNIKNNIYLNYRSYTRNVEYSDNQDIVSFVEKVKSMSFVNAVKFLHKILGIKYTFQKKAKPKKVKDPLEIFKKHESCGHVDVNEIRVIEEEALNDYLPLIHIDWYREGVMPWTAKKFGLAYSYKYKRMIIPMRYWGTGELLGINSRTVVKNYDELGIKKYYITPSYQKNLNLYGLYENYQSIQEKGYVVVYEAEKSVLKRDSLNDSTGVALSGHSMSDEQVRILLGLDVDIIIAMDKDVRIEEVRHMCEHFYNLRNVYYVLDKWDLLRDKDSPADTTNKKFNFLMKYKIKYDSKEHQRYLSDFKRKV